MCTLLIGLHVLGSGTVLAAANRDEDPGRASDPPRLLSRSPHLVGGRDRRSGGTWLAVRERRAVVALLNRRPEPGATPPAGALRSRGLLALDVASVPAEPGELSQRALAAARAALASAAYAPCSLVFLSPADGWVLAHGGAAPRLIRVAPGWHVITHADLDDRGEPRTARLLDELAGWRPGSLEEAERGLIERLSEHGAGPGGAGRDARAVCLHDGPMVTVSSSLVYLARDAARYRHAEGRPCEHALEDLSALLAPPAAAERR